MSIESSNAPPLSELLPGTWELLSRVDLTDAGERRVEPILGEDPIALLMYDRAGHFAAQFMKRDRSMPSSQAVSAATNNSRAQNGYDAYFGTYTVDDANGTVTQRLLGALSQENVGQVLTRAMSISRDLLTIQVRMTTAAGEGITRELRWRRVD